ncbi:peroxidase [Leptotrichia sp. oral taxon 498]|uniref:iron uptake transporter deferrochelatase/peroxidase subunit n=1 Tax=Leptotrichia sp. oral taxon 498 TaxID=712368 RepID=UPI000B8C9BEF|nr:iron uptake transporter deferrochelatase/peroxidase subunit [Leptotrichia sp. oral taxon 498]ASQ49076.1 peroxidase [Leptotrichia sp. oral taxon 498]
MSDENDKKWFDKKISRRDFLKKAGMVGAGAAIGASGAGAIFANMFSGKANQVVGNEEISFYGEHQSGIATPVQKNVYFAVLDLHSTDKEEIKQMFKDWTDYSEKLMKGELVAPELANHLVPPIDTGETVGLNPYRLTITFGISPSFLDKLKLDNKKMEEFKDLPHFPRDQIKDKYKGGDICIQACADDAQVAFHAVRNLVRKGRALITLKWTQAGFLPIGNGTENPKNNNDFKNVVWYDKNNWLKNGTFLIVRRIQMHLETWDRTNLQEQENTFGRYKESGAPFGETDEFATIDINKKGPDGKPVLPIDSHVYLAKKADVKIARRAFSYSNGIDEVSGQFDAGLLFICFQKHPDQFIKIQNSLGNDDKLNEYITHVGTGIFACFGGIKKGEYIGQKLFE